MEFTTADCIALVAAIIGALSGLGGIFTAVNARKEAARSANEALKAQHEALEAQNEATRIANEAARLQALEWTGQYFEGVREWSEEVVASISTLIHLPDVTDNATRSALWFQSRANLSALCDRGRWFFPNKFEKEYGTQKEPAYRGVRRRILDFVLAAYDAVPKCPSSDDRGPYAALLKAQRSFVSEVQTVLNPRHREEQVSAVVDRFCIADRMRIPTDIDQS